MAIEFNGDIIKNEPVLLSGLVEAVLVLLLAFGFDISNEQIASIMAIVTIILAILARLIVTPNNKIEDETPPPPTVVEPPAV